MPKAIGIYREGRLSGKQNHDQKILDLTAERLKKKGFKIFKRKPQNFSKIKKESPGLIFTMARGERINEILIKKEKEGTFIVNSPKAILLSLNRKLAYQKMKEFGVKVPKTKAIKIDKIKFPLLRGKLILKPANRHQFCFPIENKNDFNRALREYKIQKIKEILIQEFIEGEHIKYYVIGKEVILPKNIENKISPILKKR